MEWKYKNIAVPKLSCTLKSLWNFQKVPCQASTPRHFDVIGTRCDLGVSIFKSSPGVSSCSQV